MATATALKPSEDALPFELLPGFKELNIGGLGVQGYARAALGQGGTERVLGTRCVTPTISAPAQLARPS